MTRLTETAELCAILDGELIGFLTAVNFSEAPPTHQAALLTAGTAKRRPSASLACLIHLEANLAEDLRCREPADGARGVNRVDDLPLGVDEEPCCVEVRFLAGVHVGSRGRRHCGCIDLGIHREADTQAFFQAAHVVDGIDRCCRDTHTEFLQWASVNGKVNQLLTAVRSPIAAIEQDDRPPPSYRSRDIDFAALQVGSSKGRQPVTGYEMFGHFESVGQHVL